MSVQRRTALFSVVAAAGLVALKLVTGLLTGSLGLVADAVHSASDLVAALLTFLAVGVASQPADREHPFGHRKAEHLVALAEAAFLLAAGAYIIYEGVSRLLSAERAGVDATWYAFAVLGVVICVDASRAWISWRVSRRYGSPALAANALHFASDLLSSAAVLLGLVLVRAGYPAADAVAALLVAALIVFAATRLLKENVQTLMDRAPERAEEASRRALASLEPGVRLRRLRIREAAGEHFADVVVTVEPDAAVAQGHAVADSVESTVEEAIKRTSSATGAVDVVVHVEPGEATGTLRGRATAAAYTVVGIREVHNVRVLEVTGGRELSMHLKLPNDLPLERAHEVASEVASAVRDALPELARVHTHIEPLEEPEPGERFRVDGHHQEMLREIERVVRNAGVEANAHEVGLYRSGGGGLDAVLHCDFSRSVEVEEVHVRTEVIERALRSRFPELEQILVHAEPRQEP